MPTRRAVTLSQNNDEVLAGVVTDQTGVAQDITTTVLEMYLKATPETDDTDPDVVKLSTATGEITISGPPNTGHYSVAIPDSALTEAGIRWYRVDAVSGATRKTVVYGPLKIRDL